MSFINLKRMELDIITYDFNTCRISIHPETNDYKTIHYTLTLYAWFYVIGDKFERVRDDYNGVFDNKDIKHFMIYSNPTNCEPIRSSFEFYSSDGEFCNIYKYKYFIDDEVMTLFKVVPYICDWAANPDCDNRE